MHPRTLALFKLLTVLHTLFTMDYHPRTYEGSIGSRLHFLVVFAATERERGEMTVLEKMLKAPEYQPLVNFKQLGMHLDRIYIPLNSREEWEQTSNQYFAKTK